ncbi:MAG: hypothetical protein QM496_08400, partial [Verrucomicrobiota bacterium]
MHDHPHPHDEEAPDEPEESCDSADSSCSSCSFDPTDLRPQVEQAKVIIDAPVVTRLAVEGVDCPDEAKLIQQALEPVSGV